MANGVCVEHPSGWFKAYDCECNDGYKCATGCAYPFTNNECELEMASTKSPTGSPSKFSTESTHSPSPIPTNSPTHSPTNSPAESLTESTAAPTVPPEPTPVPPTLPIPTQCSDGTQNEDETDVDCGGACPSCALGQKCMLDNDCSSRSCSSGTCLSVAPNVAPTDTPTVVPTSLTCEVGYFYDAGVLGCQPCPPGASKKLKVRVQRHQKLPPLVLIFYYLPFATSTQGPQQCEPCPLGYSQPFPVSPPPSYNRERPNSKSQSFASHPPSLLDTSFILLSVSLPHIVSREQLCAIVVTLAIFKANGGRRIVHLAPQVMFVKIGVPSLRSRAR